MKCDLVVGATQAGNRDQKLLISWDLLQCKSRVASHTPNLQIGYSSRRPKQISLHLAENNKLGCTRHRHTKTEANWKNINWSHECPVLLPEFGVNNIDLSCFVPNVQAGGSVEHFLGTYQVPYVFSNKSTTECTVIIYLLAFFFNHTLRLQ